LRLIAGHPDLQLVLATGERQAGSRVADLYPSLAAAYGDLVFGEADPAAADGLDVVFLALPHGASQHLVPDLAKRVGTIVDLAADFRLKDPALYPAWYGEEHEQPGLLADAAFGIPELFRDSLKGAKLIAAAGCHVTAAALALAPLVRAGVIDPTGVVVDTITAPSRPTPSSVPSTRTSLLTGCCGTGTPRRSNRPPVLRSSSRRISPR
jgi:N-acetyl-gamma-glutamyl-phosphate reductase